MISDYPVTIRPAAPHDVPDMIRLERASSTVAHWSEEEYGRLFHEEGLGPRLALIACNLPPDLPDEPSRAVGFLVARHVASEWELENLVVAPESRKKGIGAQLMLALLEHVQQTKGECVFLEVRESNAAAMKLYEKLGFKQTGRRKSYYTSPLEDAVLYSKDLRGERM